MHHYEAAALLCESLVVMLALLAGSIRTSMLFQVRLHQHWGSWAPRFG